MPWTAKQHRFFALCAYSPGKANKKCPSKEDSQRMVKEGVKKSDKEKAKFY